MDFVRVSAKANVNLIKMESVVEDDLNKSWLNDLNKKSPTLLSVPRASNSSVKSVDDPFSWLRRRIVIEGAYVTHMCTYVRRRQGAIVSKHGDYSTSIDTLSDLRLYELRHHSKHHENRKVDLWDFARLASRNRRILRRIAVERKKEKKRKLPTYAGRVVGN